MQDKTDYKSCMFQWREECFKVQRERDEIKAELNKANDLLRFYCAQFGCETCKSKEHPKGQWIPASDPPKEGEEVMRVLLQDGQVRHVKYNHKSKAWIKDLYLAGVWPIAVTHYMLEPELPNA